MLLHGGFEPSYDSQLLISFDGPAEIHNLNVAIEIQNPKLRKHPVDLPQYAFPVHPSHDCQEACWAFHVRDELYYRIVY